MRIIARSNKFNKQLLTLPRKQQIKAFNAIEKFITGKYDKQLKVHKLNPKSANRYAFSVEYDLRIIYSIKKDIVIIHYLEQIGANIIKYIKPNVTYF